MTFDGKRAAAALVAGILVLASCAVNPATGKRELSLVGEKQEVELGRENDAQLSKQLGAYEDPELQQYVARVGQSLAKLSERPSLPWSFRVVDDPVVNAFALPGGYLYVTRGILAHFNSEAEMAAVLGHEIGHVTAKHSVSQISKAQLAQLGLGLGSIVAPEAMSQIGSLAQQGLGLLFLKYGRDDERQADDLGLRYAVAAGYDPRPMIEMFQTLGRVSAEGGGRLPSWLSTHPAPEAREARIGAAIAALKRDFSRASIEREGYLQQIDGIVFGEDPRQGYFKGQLFLHPEMKFQLEFPQGWKLTNLREAVLGKAPSNDAAIQITLAAAPSASAALQKFLSQSGITRGSAFNRRIHGLPTSGSGFSATTEGGVIEGQAVFVEYQDKVFQILGYAVGPQWSSLQSQIVHSLESFDRVTDSRALNVEPRRLKIVRPTESMTLAAFARRYDSSVAEPTLAVINHMDPGARVEAGRSYKVVQGGPS